MRGFDTQQFLVPVSTSSETQGRSVGSGERAGRKFSSTFRPAFSPDPTDCPWVSEDAVSTVSAVLNTKKNGQKNALQIMSLVVYESETNNNFRFVFAILFCVLFSAKLKLSKINKEPSRKLIIVAYYRF